MYTFNNKEQNIQKYIHAVEGRLQMNPELSTILYHSWYVCALYFYHHGDYTATMHYIHEFYKEYYFKGDIKDTRLEVRVMLLESQTLLQNGSANKKVRDILDDAVSILKSKYADDSFWFWEVYSIYENIDSCYNNKLYRLKEMYSSKREKAAMQLEEFWKEMVLEKPDI